MSHDEQQPPSPEHDDRGGDRSGDGGDQRRRRGRRPAVLVACAATIVPAAFVGWLLWRDADAERADRVTTPQAYAPDVHERGGERGHGDVTDDKPTTPSGQPHPSPKAREGQLAGAVVVIDPGHNPGNFQHTAEINKLVDIGTNRKECDTTGTATVDGYKEAAFTHDVSQRLRTLLEKEGARVTFTHDGDRAFGPCIDERARIGNDAKADAVISVHADGSAKGNRGFHVILPGPVKAGSADTSPIVAPSRDLGVRIADGFAAATGSARANYIGNGTGLDVRTDLGGLNLSTVPKVFVECGNMQDPQDAALLKNADWRQKAARGLADGLRAYLTARNS
ncbi:N-acetylmuramoyl-L-alanine amidase [Streptomyces sp. NPDC020412]|uniref:N-acetylmuramoyl-L-alanine amidase n=1 Tax=Streptomyces sp. NPDC020412 TaxID=3365073 RepID=UPI0037AA0F6A